MVAALPGYCRTHFTRLGVARKRRGGAEPGWGSHKLKAYSELGGLIAHILATCTINDETANGTGNGGSRRVVPFVRNPKWGRCSAPDISRPSARGVSPKKRRIGPKRGAQ